MGEWEMNYEELVEPGTGNEKGTIRKGGGEGGNKEWGLGIKERDIIIMREREMKTICRLRAFELHSKE